MRPQHVFTVTFSLPLAAYLNCQTLLLHQDHSPLSLGRLREGLVGQEGKSSLLPGPHFFAGYVVKKHKKKNIF